MLKTYSISESIYYRDDVDRLSPYPCYALLTP